METERADLNRRDSLHDLVTDTEYRLALEEVEIGMAMLQLDALPVEQRSEAAAELSTRKKRLEQDYRGLEAVRAEIERNG